MGYLTNGVNSPSNRGRILTELEEKIYRACSDDFNGMTEAAAGAMFGMTQQQISGVIRTVYEKCPSLPRIRLPEPNIVSFENSMSNSVIEKF